MSDKTNEMIVAEALSSNWRNMHTNESLGRQHMLSCHVVAALEAAGRLVGEPTDEQVRIGRLGVLTCHSGCVTECTAAGATPQHVYDVDKIAEFLNSPTHAPMSTHNPGNGECMDCPWPVYALPATDLARELVAYLEGDAS